ncbi:MAG: ABC transporter permease [Brevundimonas sp.]|nr:ABC transporter permease [Brevundimonas sp.]MDZ4060703.1 ABC transporter permease [Brevundimonas sp.]
MLNFALRRAALAVVVAVLLSVVTFVLLNAAIDPASAIAGEDASADRIAAIRAEYGLDRPLHVRYLDWLGGVLSGDLGVSYFWNQPVGELIASRAPTTLVLAFSALLVTILIAVPLGVLAALRQGTWLDVLASSIAGLAQSMPTFWIGLILMLVFAVQLRLVPVSGSYTPAHFILPAIVLGFSSVPSVLRLMRGGLIEVLQSDYIRTARAKGLLPDEVLTRHAMRNALLPVVSVLAVQLGAKLGGSVITESVFAINGLGRLALDSVLAADMPTLQILVFVFAMVFLILTFLADLLNAWLDPRIRVG